MPDPDDTYFEPEDPVNSQRPAAYGERLRSWTNPATITESRLLLGDNDDDRDGFIEDWRMKAKAEIRRCMKLVEAAERAIFAEESFFFCRDNGLLGPEADDPPLPEDVDEDAAVRNVDRANSQAPDPADHY